MLAGRSYSVGRHGHSPSTYPGGYGALFTTSIHVVGDALHMPHFTGPREIPGGCSRHGSVPGIYHGRWLVNLSNQGAMLSRGRIVHHRVLLITHARPKNKGSADACVREQRWWHAVLRAAAMRGRRAFKRELEGLPHTRVDYDEPARFEKQFSRSKHVRACVRSICEGVTLCVYLVTFTFFVLCTQHSAKDGFWHLQPKNKTNKQKSAAAP